jgi:hypothetical protein
VLDGERLPGHHKTYIYGSEIHVNDGVDRAARPGTTGTSARAAAGRAGGPAGHVTGASAFGRTAAAAAVS